MDTKRGQNIVTDLKQAIETKTGRTTPRPDRTFHQHTEYVAYGLRTSDFYGLMQTFRPRFLKLSLDERVSLAQHLLNTHIGELGHTGIHLLYVKEDELTPRHFPGIDRLMDEFRSWSHVDHLCGCVLQPLLLKYRKETLAQLKIWNGSPQRFKRRASVVTFVRKVGKSGEFTREVLQMCENLIWDEEDIVRKGVGWALKDNLRAAPDVIIPYVKKLRMRGVSSTITLYAIRDLKGSQRQELLAIKKKPQPRG
jgi:3-methyladenine DNA glycosylase AlkD